jgi:hypothetical protein
MKQILDKFLSQKKLLAFLLGWLFINIIIIFSSHDNWHKDDFWPFTSLTIQDTYNMPEFLFYGIGPFIGVFIYFLVIDES